MMSRLNGMAGLTLAFLVLASCGTSDEPFDCDPIAATLVSRIEVTPARATLADGELVQLIAVAYSCDGTQMAPPAFTWQSIDATTVSVGTTGMAAGVKNGGPVTVIASTQGRQGTAAITVAPRAVASVRVEPATAIVAVGRTSTLVARAFDAQGGELPGRPVVWSSSNTGIVTVSSAGAITGVTVGGPVTITATIEGMPGSAELSVVDAAVTTIAVSPPASTISVGSTVQLQAVLRDDQGNVLTGRAVLWSTSDATRATVSGSGLVAGVSPGGPVTIVATSEGRSGSAQVTLSPLPLTITTSALPPSTVGVAYEQTLAATGGVRPYSWTISSGNLPPGNALSSAGVLSGTPTADGSFSFTVRLADAASQSATQALTVQVGAALTVTTTNLPSATIGGAYSSQLAASGGAIPYNWAVTSGTLPPGVSLSSAGLLSGAPTAAGSSTFIVQVTDGSSRTATRALTLVVGASVGITTTTIPGGTVGSSYSQQLSATGGATPYSWTVSSGSLPAGLSLSSAGIISGTPATAGSVTFTVRVTDATSRTDTQALTVTVGSTLSIATASVPDATVGATYSQQLSATGGASPYTWSVAMGTLPDGLSLSAAGLLSGTPSTPGNSTFTVNVADGGAGSASRGFTLTVVAPLGITTTTLPPAISGLPYNQVLAASGGSPPYSWSVAAGALPGGLTLSADGVLAGTPTIAGSYSFSVQATDGASGNAVQAFTVDVAAGEAAEIVWLQQPTDTDANELMSPGPRVRVQDRAGNMVNAAMVDMSISRPNRAAFAPTSTNRAGTVAGVATFDNLRIASPERNVRLRASVAGITSAESAMFRVK